VRTVSRIAALLLAAALGLGVAAPAAAKPPVWVVHGPKGTITLFGSVHLLPAGLDWRPAALDAALASADEVWFELPIDAATNNEVAQLAIARGALPKGKHLSQLLTAGQAARLAKAAAALNCPPQALDVMQPWMAELTLGVAEDVRGGASGSDGVEQTLQTLTPASVQRRAFETAAEQIEFLAGSPVADQVASLSATVDEIDDDPGAYRRVVDEWMAADIAGLQRDAIDPVVKVSPRLYERLVGQRNRRWVQTLTERLKRPGRIVVVVGAGHLIGPRGVPALLRAQGFRVDGP
jgi:hypothetical protein